MAQQVQHPHRLGCRLRDERHAAPAAAIDASILELGQDVVDRRVDRDLALLDQHHEGDRGDRLGHRGDTEDRAFVDRFVGSLARGALAAEMDDLVVAADEDLGVRQLACVEVARLDEAIEPLEAGGVEAMLLGGLDLHRVSSSTTGDVSRNGRALGLLSAAQGRLEMYHHSLKIVVQKFDIHRRRVDKKTRRRRRQ